MCYRAEFGHSALKGVGKPQNWGALELCCLGMGAVSLPKIHAPPHIKFGSFCDKRVYRGVCINRKKGTPSGWKLG